MRLWAVQIWCWIIALWTRSLLICNYGPDKLKTHNFNGLQCHFSDYIFNKIVTLLFAMASLNHATLEGSWWSDECNSKKLPVLLTKYSLQTFIISFVKFNSIHELWYGGGKCQKQVSSLCRGQGARDPTQQWDRNLTRYVLWRRWRRFSGVKPSGHWTGYPRYTWPTIRKNV